MMIGMTIWNDFAAHAGKARMSALRPMLAIPLLLWVTHKQTVIKVSHHALAP